MFESKQSNYWYDENSREFFVCAITSVSAQGPACKGDLVAHYPLIYRIDRDTNRKDLVYPDTASGQLTSVSAPGYVYDFVPDHDVNINISEIDKPHFSHNDQKNLYNITFRGRYADINDGFSIFSYTFQYADNQFVPVDARVFAPENKHLTDSYTFSGNNLNKRFFVDAADTTSSTTYFGILSAERPPNYRLRPYHDGDYLIFNSLLYTTNSTLVEPDSALPFGFNAGYIAQRCDSFPFKSSECIRVDFTCKSFIEQEQRGFLSTKTVSGTVPSVSSWRTITQYPLSGGERDGFAVFFYADDGTDVLLKGVGSSFGYTPTSATQLEAGGFYFPTDALTVSGFACVAFDVGGNFCTGFEGKEQGYNGTTYTTAPSTIGVRAGIDNDYKVIGRSAPITSVKICEYDTDFSAAVDRDFRVELMYGKKIVVSGKLSSDSSYTTLYTLDFDDLSNFDYEIPDAIRVGLVSSNGTYIHNFNLKSFEVKGTYDN